ncbi:hypothetical protein PR048_009652 [Dryococelus australis]|uniref:Uncharacterized protein n=1 Tax=Dryococelus australis TaxID=614101 RepID=A0ABQ9I0J4_9NEOP|nr:hypothetical protein PR048_009652 [Dryococelus australis]
MEVPMDMGLHLNYLLELHDKLVRVEIELEEVTSSPVLLKLSSLTEERKHFLKSQSHTSKLWLLYLNMVGKAKTFIWAELTGNFEMHLHAVEYMLPRFASFGHNNYAKCACIYLQQMRKLKQTSPEVYTMLNDSHFTVRKHNREWTGVWIDMCIEQTLMRFMRCTKSRSGITHGGVSRISSVQYTEISDARMARDFQDMKAIMEFFNSPNPFNNKVTTEKDIIGRHMQEKLTGKLFRNVTMFKSDQAVTMQVLKKGIIIADETLHIDTHLPTQRMFVCFTLDKASKDAREYFSYELSTIPHSLFDPRTQLMRKTDKSSLAIALYSMTVNQTKCSQTHEHTYFVLDGGAFLHELAWFKSGTFGDIIRQYESYVDMQYGKLTIVLDGYLTRVKQSSVTHFQDKGYSVIYAHADADTLILKTALNIAKERHITVVADDTDILVLLLHHCCKNINCSLPHTEVMYVILKLCRNQLGKKVARLNILLTH